MLTTKYTLRIILCFVALFSFFTAHAKDKDICIKISHQKSLAESCKGEINFVSKENMHKLVISFPLASFPKDSYLSKRIYETCKTEKKDYIQIESPYSEKEVWKKRLAQVFNLAVANFINCKGDSYELVNSLVQVKQSETTKDIEYTGMIPSKVVTLKDHQSDSGIRLAITFKKSLLEKEISNLE